jgi:ABC-type dipeptide/oligopeptide/nickel transport system ATPase component
MKADRILVVMNGEIVEEGSHFDLIHTNGKYQDLWSKQIFVKPTSENDHDKSSPSKKRDADIVDDITNTQSTQRLATAMKNAPHEEPDGGENGNGKGSDKADRSAVSGNAESKQNGEVSAKSGEDDSSSQQR